MKSLSLRKFELFVAFRYLRARRGQTVISVVTVISVLGVTAGVMALNIALALNAGVKKEFQNRRPVSWYSLTGNGRGALATHVTGLRDLLERAKT